MSLSHAHRQLGPGPADLEFRALETAIDIVPKFKMDAIDALDGSTHHYGPFVPPKKNTVPLWMAIHLKQKKKCRIVAPRWLGVGELEATLAQEMKEGAFSPLPSEWLEVSKVILEVAPDDLPAPDAVRILLKDIREARQAKVRAGLRALNPIHLGMPNLSTMEIHSLAPFFGQAFGRMVQLDPQVDRHAYIEELWLEKPEEALRRSEAGEFGFEGATQDAEGSVY